MSALQPMACRTLGPEQPLIREFIISPFLNRAADAADEKLTVDRANPTDDNNLEIRAGERIFSLHLYVQRTMGRMDVETSLIASQIIPKTLGNTIVAKATDESENWKAYLFYFRGGKKEELDEPQRNIIEIVKKAILDSGYAFKMREIKKADEARADEINEFGRREFGRAWAPRFGEELFRLELSPMGKSNL